jgi:AcrR family transcriptional regulator
MGPRATRKVAVREWRDPAAEMPARERLLVATRELMAERDTIDVSIADIAARASANVALVSYYFGGREGLLVALAKRDADETLGPLDELMNSDLPPDDKMRRHIVAVVETYFYRPYIYRLLHALLRNSTPKIAREVGDFFIRPLAEARKKMLQDGFKSGAFRKVDPMLTHCAIHGACANIFVVYGFQAVDEALCRRYADATADLIVRGLAADGAARKPVPRRRARKPIRPPNR